MNHSDGHVCGECVKEFEKTGEKKHCPFVEESFLDFNLRCFKTKVKEV